MNKKYLREKYYKIKKINDLTSNYEFIDRKKNCENLVIILAGFKKFLWDDVFDRISKNLNSKEKYDICIVSSGIFSNKLNEIAAKNNWSYLSLKRNNVCLALNTAINLFNEANFIFKLDEDIFITNNYFHKLKKSYMLIKEEKINTCGFIAPVMPLNGIGYVEILKKYNMIDDYEKTFNEKVKYSSAIERKIISDGNVAKYFWSNKFPSIDQMNNDFENNLEKYSVSPVLFSIGAILFERSLWEKMHMFPVSIIGNDMGHDEMFINQYCFVHSKSVIVSLNTVVGHFAYGPQMEKMKDFYKNNKNRFI